MILFSNQNKLIFIPLKRKHSHNSSQYNSPNRTHSVRRVEALTGCGVGVDLAVHVGESSGAEIIAARIVAHCLAVESVVLARIEDTLAEILADLVLQSS